MNRAKLLGLFVSALLLVIVFGCGRKGPPSLPQRPSSSVNMKSEEFRNAPNSFRAITPLNGRYAGFSFTSHE